MNVFEIPSLEWFIRIAIKGVALGAILRLAEYVFSNFRLELLKKIWAVLLWWFSTWPHSIVFGIAFSLLAVILLPNDKSSEIIVSGSILFMAVVGSFLAPDLRKLLGRFKG